MTGLNPRKRFYISYGALNSDGTVDHTWEARDAHETLEEAIAQATEEADQHGGELFVYECRPIKRIARITVRVEDVEEEQ